jgi:nucleotide-binding universal stress UspA family protein
MIDGAAERPRVVVGVDGSAGARAALLWAAAEAMRRGARLEVVHAWMAVGAQQAATKVADDAASTAALIYPTLDVVTSTPQIAAAQALLEAGVGADVLVVGPRGLGGFRGLLLGSVSHQCIEHAPCPVVVVRERPAAPASAAATAPAADATPGVVVAVDGSPGADAALRWAMDEAARRKVAVQIVYAWQFPPLGGFVVGPPDGYESVADEILSKARATAHEVKPEVPVQAVSRFGATVPVILDASVGAELLVVGARGHGGFGGLLLGSTAQSCARHAPCPVAIVRPEPVASDPAAVASDPAAEAATGTRA